MPKLKNKKEFSPEYFREKLKKIMPGYNWTVHKSFAPEEYLYATGCISAGFNRVSTLSVEMRVMAHDKSIWYESKIAGFGLKASFSESCGGATLAQSLRELQNFLEGMASSYSAKARYLRSGRGAEVKHER